MAQKLSAGFMAELFKLVYMDLNITRMVVNNLTYQLIPKEWPGFKFLLKEATEVLKEKDKVPSLGVVSQKYADSDFVIEAIDAVQAAAKVDKEIIIDQLEAYIKDVEFQLLSKKVHDLYEEGKKEDAIRVNAEESQRILSLSLRHEAGGFQKVFADFDKRMRGRREDEAHLTQAMEYIRRYLIRIRGNREVQIIGPASEAVSKINDLYRMAVYVRAPQEEVLAELREKLERYIEINKGFRTVYLQFDFSRKY